MTDQALQFPACGERVIEDQIDVHEVVQPRQIFSFPARFELRVLLSHTHNLDACRSHKPPATGSVLTETS